MLRLGLAGSISVDPADVSPASAQGVLLLDLLYDGLTTLDPQGRAVADVAEFRASADLRTWRFDIVDGATFADGSPITADDVIYSLQRLIDRGTGSFAALQLPTIAGLAADGPGAVLIELAMPSTVLPELLSSPLYPVVDREATEQLLAGGDTGPNGSGDYAATLEARSRLVLQRRSGEGPAVITIDLLTDESAAFDAFVDGELDWTIVPPDRLGEAVDVAGTRGLTPFQGGLYLGVDAAVPPIDREPLRRAIALAVDRTAIAEVAYGLAGQPLEGVLPAGIPGIPGGCRGPCGPDLPAARALAAQAYPDGQVKPLRLLIDDSEVHRTVSQVLEQQVESAGLDMVVESVDVGSYESLVAAGQQQLFLFGWLGVARTPASHLPALFHSASPDNVVGLSDPAVDDAIDAIETEPIAAERARGWRELEVAILERVAVVPLVQLRTLAVHSDRVDGLVMHADGSVDLSAIELTPLRDS